MRYAAVVGRYRVPVNLRAVEVISFKTPNQVIPTAVRKTEGLTSNGSSAFKERESHTALLAVIAQLDDLFVG